ncbi:hypothetical protein SAMN05216497_13114 [Clostridium cochlearium]|uniref:CRISPR type III-B/RAMP module-associated protein Cmr5 n=1 Tax=Clostridium cochlearium TaxID=1494 RepID=A0ABY0QP28_CLOCO|nr:hypothetical protein [Clostridium cochlearium]SDL41863.1 hypothetical protein SAMN05216497_13114 [Clostridium cochlearium]
MNREIREVKNELIDYVEEIFSNKNFWEGKNIKSKKYAENLTAESGEVGSTNVRNLANTALNADSYKEFKLYMKYKTAKGNGWELPFKTGDSLGDTIVKYLDKIYEKNKDDEKEVLKNISRFFGYFYWKKKYVESKNK